MQITITDWQKFNPRSDRANYSWFRFENKFYIKTFSWGAEVQRIFTYLCCCASQENKPTFEFDIELASVLLKRKPTQIAFDIKHLEKIGMITADKSRHEAVKEPALLPATYERTNVTNEHTHNAVKEPAVFDFDIVYGKYPRKIGRKKGIETCRSQIKTQSDFDSLLLAIQRYSDHCRLERVEPKFIKHFSTFMNSWTDWVLQPQPKQITKPIEPKIIETPLPIEKDLPSPESVAKVRNLIASSFKRL